ncbi:hypothetical protein [Zhongshania marina]|uniref:Uncharacterized protein n=1 Tax=Zhongshania marina TaxID=2304603 RepID=A0A2S4HGH4_9GAMM|nr:hypothetical protein [Marortus luteolus]POP53086.1 hypothetical protein C0068_08320 [Marortus luteolus]
MKDNKVVEFTGAEATLACGITNAYFTNLLLKQSQGQNTEDPEVKAACLSEARQAVLDEIKLGQAQQKQISQL